MVFEGLFARARNGDRAAEASTHAPPAPVRPTIGLALGGGAARGFAHIGVIRALEAHGIVPDVIVGTSIGAVVGGCYAAKEMDNLESWARTLTVRGVLEHMIGGATEFDDKPGPVRDMLAGGQRTWIDTLKRTVRQAVDEGQLPAGTDPEQIAFEMFGIALVVHHHRRLLGYPKARARALAALDKLLSR